MEPGKHDYTEVYSRYELDKLIKWMKKNMTGFDHHIFHTNPQRTLGFIEDHRDKTWNQNHRIWKNYSRLDILELKRINQEILQKEVDVSNLTDIDLKTVLKVFKGGHTFFSIYRERAVVYEKLVTTL